MFSTDHGVQLQLALLGNSLRSLALIGQGSTVLVIPHDSNEPLQIMLDGNHLSDAVVEQEFNTLIAEAFLNRREIVTARMADEPRYAVLVKIYRSTALTPDYFAFSNEEVVGSFSLEQAKTYAALRRGQAEQFESINTHLVEVSPKIGESVLAALKK